jgi:hypothetical protein
MASGISGIAQLDRMIAKVRAIGSGPEYVQAAAKAVTTFLQSELAAGKDPNTGTAWKPTIKGERALKTAQTRPQIRIAGRNIIISLMGYYVFQHFPTRGREGRRVIPQGSMPQKLGNAIGQGLVAPFRKEVGK